MRCIWLFLLLMCTTACGEEFCGFEMHCSAEQASRVVHANDSMTLGRHTREGRSQRVVIVGGPLNGSLGVFLDFFDDQLYRVIVSVDSKKISVQQLAKLAERKYGANHPRTHESRRSYEKMLNGFVVMVIETDKATGITMYDEAMDKACQKYKLDEIGSL